jgi:hypothetical protein
VQITDMPFDGRVDTTEGWSVMDSDQFDKLIKRLTTRKISRASALRGIVGGALAGIAGATLATGSEAGKKGKKSKKRKVRKNQLRAQGGGAGKVTICHFTHSEDNPYNIISVSANSLEAHQRHGDFEYVDCCLDSECDDENLCTVDACDQGTCTYTPVECDVACLGCDSATGECTVDLCTGGETCNTETGECEGGTCGESGDSCSEDPDCCEDLICRSNGACGSCSPSGTGGSCGDDHDCCGSPGNVVCYQGACCNKRNTGASCTNNNQCCSNTCTDDDTCA